MNIIFAGFLTACAFGVISTYYFLKASSIYFSYKEGVRRITKGEIELPNWRFIFPLKENKTFETKGLVGKRIEHQKFITRYWIMVILMVSVIVITMLNTTQTAAS